MPLGGDLLWEKKANSPSCRGTFLPHFQLILQALIVESTNPHLPLLCSIDEAYTKE